MASADVDRALLAWARSRGARIGVRVRDGGAAAPPAGLAAGAVVAEIPDECVLTVESTHAGDQLTVLGLGPRSAKTPGGAWRQATGLALALLLETAHGDSGDYAPSIAWLAAGAA